MSDIVALVVGALLALAASASVYRIVRGPAILDRMIASDMLVTTVICVLGLEMVHHGHTRTIPIMLVLALVSVFASITVARYVSKKPGSASGIGIVRRGSGDDRPAETSTESGREEPW